MKAPITEDDIRAELANVEWWGRDPFKSRRVMELAPFMVPARFDTAADYVAALVAAVEQSNSERTDHKI